MDIIEMLEEIRRKPGFYLDGDISLKRLRSFMVGYEEGAGSTTRKLTDEQQFHQFNDWVARRLGYPMSGRGWCGMIIKRAGDDEKAFHMFFELLDEFKGRSGSTSAKPES